MLLAALLLPACGGNPSVQADGQAQREVPLPVLMYHSVLQDPTRAGQYVVSPDTLREDLTYLRERGFESVVTQDLIAYVDGEGTLPEKPVMITLDDGYYNNLLYVLPILEELAMKAVICVVGNYADVYTQTPDPNPNYGHLSWEEIARLAESGRVEIANHSYAMHSQDKRPGSKRKGGESEEAYREAFMKDARAMQEALWERAGVRAAAYAYPYGQISPETREYLKELGLQASYSCYERINYICPGEADCLFELGRYNRPACLSTAEFMQKALKGIP